MLLRDRAHNVAAAAIYKSWKEHKHKINPPAAPPPTPPADSVDTGASASSNSNSSLEMHTSVQDTIAAGESRELLKETSMSYVLEHKVIKPKRTIKK